MTDLVVVRTLDIRLETGCRKGANTRALSRRGPVQGLRVVGDRSDGDLPVVVLTDIFIKGCRHSRPIMCRLELKIDPEDVDPQGSKNPAVIRDRRFSGNCPQGLARRCFPM